ncbi:hypothetical protein BD311DRAFT_720632 [Dichomitus squalens]|uniref:DUF6533 domain-containing protein n=1 Tax=Dichomitus squalens TaxID=114155 RepID=A0A4Q9MNZ0_9APHY|nr:hypothetical protein BD311DRAFT_720632 [Dichomitus squalens]
MANNSAVQAISASFFYNCWTDAALALFIYDFILTLDSELMLFWTVGHVSGATILFLLNRYITLASQIIDNNTIPSSVESAFAVDVAACVLEALQYLPWAAFSALRTYALCPDPYRRLISASVFALSSVPIFTIMWTNLHGLSFVNDPVLGIIPINPISVGTVLRVDVVTRSSVIASNLVVLCVTWLRTYETAKLSLRRLGKRSFASILLLDGTMYFLPLLVLSTLQMTFTLIGVSGAGVSWCLADNLQVDDNAHFPTSVIVYLEEPLTSILTSRFLIDLQKAQRKLAGSSRSVSLGEIAFQPQSSGNTSRFIGSLGAQISFHEVDEGENEAEVAS